MGFRAPQNGVHRDTFSKALFIALGNSIKKNRISCFSAPLPVGGWCHTAISSRLRYCGKARMRCARAPSATFHQRKAERDHQAELKVHFGKLISKKICPVAKWKNPAPKTMRCCGLGLFFFPHSTRQRKKRGKGKEEMATLMVST